MSSQPELEAIRPEAIGPCCACGQAGPSVRNFVFLERKTPYAGTGWGCLVCDLPADGAVAVICDRCAAANTPPVTAIAGPIQSGRRIPVAELIAMPYHRHDHHQHQAAYLSREFTRPN